MDRPTRRRVLALLAGATGATAGCLGGDEAATPTGESSPETRTGGESPTLATPTRTRRAPTNDGTPVSATDTRTPLPPSAIESVEGSWPGFAFDPANTGLAPDASGPADEPRVQWHAEYGASVAAPVVAAETVVVPYGRGGVVGLDATDGTERWTANVGGWHVRSPAVAEDLALVIGESSLHAFDLADGTTAWSDGGYDEVFGGLTVADGTCYACPDEGVTAFDAATGEERWRTDFSSIGSVHGPPAVADGTVVVRTHGGGPTGLAGLDAETGERLWRTELGRFSVPRLVDGTVYVGARRGHTDPYEVPTVYELDATTGDATPLFTTEGRGAPDLAVTGERLIVAERVTDPPDRPATTMQPPHDHGETDDPDTATVEKPTRVYALDRDGMRQWTATVAEDPLLANQWGITSPAVADGVIYLALEYGRVVALDAASGDRLWSVDSERLRGDLVGPAVVDGVVFVAADSGVVALA